MTTHHSERLAVESDLRALAAALARIDSVHDAAILRRTNTTGADELVAFVVPADAAFDHMPAAIEAAVAGAVQTPWSYVFVSKIPLTRDGQPDETALWALPLNDAALARAWEERLRTIPAAARATVELVAKPRKLQVIHLSDLIPTQAASAETTSASQPARDRGAARSGSQAPSIAHGEPLSADGPVTLVEAMRNASDGPHGIVYVDREGHETRQSYRELLAEAQRILGGLRAAGVEPADKVIFQLDQPRDFIPAFWACALGGMIAVPVSIPLSYDEVGGAVAKLRDAWELLDHPLIVASPASASAVRHAATLLGKTGWRVADVGELRAAAPATDYHASHPEDLALMLLTSGSTGMPKLVQHCHRSVLANAKAASRANQFHAGDVSLNWFPLDHVGGLVMFHVRDVYLGCQQIQAPMESVLAEPLTWLDWIDRYRATITWAPNFAYAMVNARGADLPAGRWNLSSMRFLLNGGEAIVARQARRFLELLAPYGLPAHAMHPAWGMSETASGVTYSERFRLETTSDDDPFVEVGRPVSGFSMRVVDESNQVLPEGKRGFLQVKGASVTSGYFRAPEVQRDSFTPDGWFITGDLATMQGGRLTIVGRSKDIIIVNGLNYGCHEIEAVVEQIPGVEVSYTAAVAVRRSEDTTDRLAIFFHATDSAQADLVSLIAKIRARVVEDIGLNPGYVLPVSRDAIPKTNIGKIQRAQLKERFERGAFNDLVKRIDLQLENASTLPEWFYRQTWVRKELAGTREIEPATTLVFLDRAGLGAWLCETLARRGSRCIGVEAGAEFEALAGDRFRIAPGEPAQHDRLIESLTRSGVVVDRIVHLWTYQDDPAEPVRAVELESAQERGLLSLTFLAQALSRAPRGAAPLSLLYVTSYTQTVQPSDRVAYAKAPALALVATLDQEISWLRARAVDLPYQAGSAHGDAVLAELETPHHDAFVSYRGGQRFISLLEHVQLHELPVRPAPLRTGGAYVISGGLGGIGVEVARYLLRNHQARVLLLGRRPLPDRGAWPALLERGGETARRIRNLQVLERLGEVRYEAVDVEDEAQLGAVLARARQEWRTGPDGVFHLAGVLHPGEVSRLTRDDLHASLRPKMTGTVNLYRLTRDMNGPFVLFSSVNGHFGGTGYGAYAAANRFLDAFAAHHREDERLLCVAWSMWRDTGMTEGLGIEALSEARGYRAFSISQGLHSLLAALYRTRGHLFIGLDGAHQGIGRLLANEPATELQELQAYLGLEAQAAMPPAVEALIVSDRFGRSTRCKLVREVATRAPSAKYSEPVVAQPGASPTEAVDLVVDAEQKLVEIWKEVLDLTEIEHDQSFFDLGGHSLLVPSVQKRIEETFARRIAQVDIFRYPTIGALARFLVGSVEAVDPVAEAEQKLVEIWKEVLDLTEIEHDQSFFDLGGHSLLVPSVQKRIEETFARRIAQVDIFRYPTIGALARFLIGQEPAASARRS